MKQLSSCPRDHFGRIIAHFGGFDADNFGDLLFPFILENRLNKICENILHFSPSGRTTKWQDALQSLSILDIHDVLDELDGIIVGGGHIIRADPTALPQYKECGLPPDIIYPALWVLPGQIAVQRNIPLCWNAPGVPKASTVGGALLSRATSSANYLSVRDNSSKEILVAAGVTKEVKVVPDTAIEIARIWPKRQLTDSYASLLKKARAAVPSRSFVFHVKSRYLDIGLETLANTLDRICQRFTATAVLIAFGPCHHDDEIQSEIGNRMNSNPIVISRPENVKEIAASIAFADLYVGSSLHGLITAFSYKKNGIVIADETKAGFNKFSGFLNFFDQRAMMVNSWSNIEAHIEKLVGREFLAENELELIEQKLDYHWNRIERGLFQSNKMAKSRPGSKLTIPRSYFDNMTQLESRLWKQLNIT